MTEIKVDIQIRDDGEYYASLHDGTGLIIVNASDVESLENEIKRHLQALSNINPDEVKFDYNPV